MSVSSGNTHHGNDARDNRVPPAIRLWAQRQHLAIRVSRYSNKNESVSPGYKVHFKDGGHFNPATIPPGYSLEHVSHSRTGGMRVQIRPK